MPGPTARTLRLLELLQAGGLRTTASLATALQVDERTVRRDVERLLELGVPVETVRGRHGGYRIGAGSRLPPLMLTDDEALAVVVALAGSAADGAAAASAKIRRVLPAALRTRLDGLLATAALGAAASPPGDAAVVLAIGQAAADGTPVRIRYRDREGAESTRVVLPWGLVARGERWYLTGPDSSSGDLRTFRLDRVLAVEPTAGRFSAPAGFDAARHVAGALARVPRAHDVSVLVRADRGAVRRRFPEGIARVASVPADLRSGEEGWLRVRMQGDDLPRLAGELIALDAPFVVERPATLADEVAGRWRRLGDRLPPTVE